MATRRRTTVEMYRDCLHHQHPEDYGRPEVPPPYYPPLHSTEEIAHATGLSDWPLSEHCERCGCNHGFESGLIVP